MSVNHRGNMPENESADVAEILQKALALHRSANYKSAEQTYLQVLALQPGHFDALHLLGVLARQRGDPTMAIALIRRAIAQDSGQALAWCNLGAALQDLGESEAALAQYEHAILLRPDYALAHNNRGNALRKLGRLEEALQSYAAALQHQPDYAEAAYNRGTVLHRLERYEGALRSYEFALAKKPVYADAWCNHGSALHMLQHYEEALASFDQALHIDARHAGAWCNRGLAMQKLRRYQEALDCHDNALLQRPDYAEAHLFRGNILRLLQRPDEAMQAYRDALQFGADVEQVEFALAAMGDATVDAPALAPAAYVQKLFDQYADHFDEHLQDVLHYRTPDLLLAALQKAGISIGGDCVDLGCGTGLCGMLLRPLVRRLSGVDLSPKMLEKAAQRGIYHQLACLELSEYLSRHDAEFDLAVAADVLVYIGDLAALMQAVRHALRPGGVFAFSVEEGEDATYTLRASHRYAHSAAYLEQVAGDAGLSIKLLEQHVLREDQGVPVMGLLAVLVSA